VVQWMACLSFALAFDKRGSCQLDLKADAECASDVIAIAAKEADTGAAKGMAAAAAALRQHTSLWNRHTLSWVGSPSEGDVRIAANNEDAEAADRGGDRGAGGRTAGCCVEAACAELEAQLDTPRSATVDRSQHAARGRWKNKEARGRGGGGGGRKADLAASS
jgi:hypothetical protein